MGKTSTVEGGSKVDTEISEDAAAPLVGFDVGSRGREMLSGGAVTPEL